MNKKAFTLIELLVVITIIGILAVGAVSVFTTQLQGARDSTRINDMKIVETALHQIYNDETEFPEDIAELNTQIVPFISKALEDPKKGVSTCWLSSSAKSQACQGYYTVADDDYSSLNAVFKIGIHFEKLTNYTDKANAAGKQTDGGSVENMYELFAGLGGSGATIDTTNDIFY